MTNYQKVIFQMLKDRPIAYSPGLAKALGSVKAAVFLGQLLYWHGKGSDPEWVYKTIEEVYEETGLSKNEQSTAIKICKKFRVLDTKLKRIPAVRHFRINVAELIKLISSLLKSGKLAVRKLRVYKSDRQTTNTESSQYITQNNTSEKILKDVRKVLSDKMSFPV